MGDYNLGGKPNVLTPKQIYAVARKAGFNSTSAILATAIAMAESGGNANIVNDTPATGDLSYGLWQINMIGQMGPDRLKQFGIPGNEALADPLTNAKAAFIVSGHGRSFGPWSTYTSGAYAHNLLTAQSAASALSGPSVLDSILQSIPVVGTYADWAINPGQAAQDFGAIGNAAGGIVGGITGTAKFMGQLANLGVSGLLKLITAAGLVVLGFLLLFHKQVSTAAITGAKMGAAA